VILEAFCGRKFGAHRRGLLNVFNIRNCGVPDVNVIQQDPNTGKITSTVSDSPREIRLGAHLNF
jgi:hypothetical protein